MPADSAAFRSGDSKEGVEQLIGNAREWTSTRVRANTHSSNGRPLVFQGTWNGRVPVLAVALIGQGYEDNATSVWNSVEAYDPAIADYQTGFRCIATAQ